MCTQYMRGLAAIIIVIRVKVLFRESFKEQTSDTIEKMKTEDFMLYKENDRRVFSYAYTVVFTYNELPAIRNQHRKLY